MMTMKSHRAVQREYNRVGKLLGRERRACRRRLPGADIAQSALEFKLEAARQALAWALNDHAMAPSKAYRR